MFFAGKENNSAWDTYSIFPPRCHQCLLSSRPRPMIVAWNVVGLSCARFVVLTHDKQNELDNVNDARQHLFSRKCQSFENIPPTQATLDHRAAYPGSMCSIRCCKGNQSYQTLLNGVGERKLQPMGDLTEHRRQAYQNSYEHLHCNCRTTWKGLCKCYKAALKCTALCLCEGECEQD